MKMLGHKDIESTIVRIQRLDFSKRRIPFSVAANTVEESRKLIEYGFAFIRDMNNAKPSVREIENHA
jgi:hypothetical protein